MESCNTQYLFDSSGNWIAFQKDQYIFNKKGTWIGWLPWKDGYVVNTEGKYLGSIVSDQQNNNRFYYFLNLPCREYPGYPKDPGYPGHLGYPGSSPLPPMAEDIELIEEK